MQRDKLILMSDFAGALGRATFAFGALEYDRPFLAPLYTFASLHPPQAVRAAPTYVLVILAYLSRRLQQRRLFPCAVAQETVEEGPRIDAKAEGTTATVAGWLPTQDETGRISKSASPWFLVELSPTSAPWARDGEPFRVIATLEAMAILMSVIAFGPCLEKPLAEPLQPSTGRPPAMKAVTRTPSSFTDNKGNTFAPNRLMSTKFPLCAMTMELAAQLERRGLAMDVGWAPREWNSEADALTNNKTEGFDPRCRLHIDLRTAKWLVLDTALEEGTSFFEQVKAVKAARALDRAAAQKGSGAGRREPLRVRDPW